MQRLHGAAVLQGASEKFLNFEVRIGCLQRIAIDCSSAHSHLSEGLGRQVRRNKAGSNIVCFTGNRRSHVLRPLWIKFTGIGSLLPGLWQTWKDYSTDAGPRTNRRTRAAARDTLARSIGVPFDSWIR